MMDQGVNRRGATVDPLLGGDFQPLRVLWEGANAPYPSEPAARWALRQLRPSLADAGALGLHRGMVYVHREKFGEVVRKRAVEAATKKYGSKG